MAELSSGARGDLDDGDFLYVEPGKPKKDGRPRISTVICLTNGTARLTWRTCARRSAETASKPATLRA